MWRSKGDIMRTYHKDSFFIENKNLSFAHFPIKDFSTEGNKDKT